MPDKGVQSVGRALYTVDGVCYNYNGRTALDGVSFSIEPGERVAVLGANGTGKSTLLKLLDGLAFPDSGTVSFSGVELAEDRLDGDFRADFRSRVGFVFSEPDVQLFSPTVAEELAFGPLQLGLAPGEVDERVGGLIEMLGIEALAGLPPYALSAGEKRKVAIASVLAVDPEVLLLDEPTNGLDPRSQVWLLELMEELAAIGKTFVLSTHDLSLVEDFCERVIVLDESHKVAADGPMGEILGDKDLLLRVNIIHEHAHRHGEVVHVHSHGPFATHDEHD